jgi:hypothetical protein
MINAMDISNKLTKTVLTDIDYLLLHPFDDSEKQTLKALKAQVLMCNHKMFVYTINNIKSVSEVRQIVYRTGTAAEEFKAELENLIKYQHILFHDLARYNEYIKSHIEQFVLHVHEKTYEFMILLLDLTIENKADTLRAMLELVKNHRVDDRKRNHDLYNFCLNSFRKTVNDREVIRQVRALSTYLFETLDKPLDNVFYSYVALPKAFSKKFEITYSDSDLRAFSQKLVLICEAIEIEDLLTMRNIINEDLRILEMGFEDVLLEMEVATSHIEKLDAPLTHTLLSFATRQCKLKAMKVLLDEYHLNPNELVTRYDTPLHHLVFADRHGPDKAIYEAAKILLERGANPDIKIAGHKSPRTWVEKTAPSVLDMAVTGLEDKAPGANCRAAFATKDSPAVTFWYQMNRNAVPLAVAAGAVVLSSFNRPK